MMISTIISPSSSFIYRRLETAQKTARLTPWSLIVPSWTLTRRSWSWWSPATATSTTSCGRWGQLMPWTLGFSRKLIIFPPKRRYQDGNDIFQNIPIFQRVIQKCGGYRNFILRSKDLAVVDKIVAAKADLRNAQELAFKVCISTNSPFTPPLNS